MTLPELCIRRPVMTTLLMLAFVVFGMFSYRLLPVAAIPRVDFPTIVVSATLPGASPETMASSVATPLEQAILDHRRPQFDGLDAAGSGITNITMQFDLDRNIDGAALDVQSAMTTAAKRLPIQMTIPPSFIKVNPADFPVLFINLYSPTLPLSDVDEYAETMIAQRISTINGVAQVLVFGQQKFAVRVQVNPEALAAKDLTLDDVMNCGRGRQFLDARRLAHGVAAKLSRCRPTARSSTPPATSRSSSPTATARRCACATWRRAVDSVENDQVAGWLNGQPSVMLAVKRQPDANTVEVVDAVKALIPVFESQLPPSVQLHVLLDRSISIRNSVSDVQFTLMLTAALVVLVIFIFLEQRHRHHHSRAGAAGVGDRHLRRHGAAWATASTISRSWRSPCRWDSSSTTPSSCSRTSCATSRTASRCCTASVPRLARDRLHHHVDHAVAGGGVHSRAVHGRRRRPRLPRVRRHHQHDDPDLRASCR